MTDDETTLVNQRGTDEFDIDGGSEYREADEYVYVRARGFVGSDRKMPITRWVSECPDDIDPRSLDNPHALAYDETTRDEPHIIVGARDGHMLDIDVDVGDDHAVTFDGDHDAIGTPDGVLAFVSASGGPHRIIKFDADHDGMSGVEGVDLQGDMDGNHGVVTSPFHHPEYAITDEPEQRVTFDDALESQRLNNALGADLLDFTANEPRASDSRDANPTFDMAKAGSSAGGYDEHLTPDDVADALSYIPRDLHYNDWRSVAFAVHDYDASQDGKRLFADWSHAGAKWDSNSQNQLDGFWKHADANGERATNVTLGTLIQRAKAEGWEPPTHPSAGGGFDLNLNSGIVPEPAEDGIDWATVRALYTDDDISRPYARTGLLDGLREQYSWMTPRDSGRLWVYDPETGVYDEHGEAALRALVRAGLGAFATDNEVKQVVNAVTQTSYVRRDAVNAGDRDDALLSVGNGVLNLDTFDLFADDPDYHFIAGIPTDYDPDARCPTIDGFLSDITERVEDQRTMLEMVGNCLLPHYDFESFMVLCGDGANGKTTFFNVVSALLDDENVVGVDMGALAKGRFSVSDLHGKLANIVPDVSGTKVNDVGPIKSLSGGDSYRAERKYESAFYFQNRAKLMFGANRPPVIGERTRAIKRRILPIHLPYRFTIQDDDGNPDAKPRHKLIDELTTDEEMSGLLNRALEGIKRLRENGDFSLPESPDERLERYESFSDPIKLFASRCVENAEESVVTKDAVYDAYIGFCDREGFESKVRKTFFQQLGRTSVSVRSTRRALGDDRVRCLDNAALTDAGENYTDDRQLDAGRRITERVYGGDEQRPTPLGDVAFEDHAANPEGVTVRVLEADRNPGHDAMATIARVEDATEQAGLMAWASTVPDGLDVVDDGCYLIEHPVCGRDNKGRKQITVESADDVTEIQTGVGTTDYEDPGADHTLAEIKANAASVETVSFIDDATASQGERRDAITEMVRETSVREAVLVSHLIEAGGFDAESIERDIAAMLQDGKLIEHPDGEITINE